MPPVVADSFAAPQKGQNMHPPLARFVDHLGKRPFCSNDGTATKIRPRGTALTYSHVSLNRRRVAYLAFDVDRQGAALAWEEGGLPPPTLTMINPVNAHAHILYELAAPVLVADHARPRPIQFLADVGSRIVDSLQADPRYAGLMVKNPISGAWRLSANDCKYDLKQLLEYLPDRKPRREPEPTGWGRNCTLFDQLRAWAYPRAAAARSGSLESWIQACSAQACKLNIFVPQLPASEIRSTAKSVARWTYEKYRGSGALGKMQQAAQRVATQAGISAAEALALFPGLVAKTAGVHRDTVASLNKLTQATAGHQDT